jgi:hypothetical protein
MAEAEARNLAALRLGLPPVEGGWTPAETMRLLFLREVARREAT